MLSEYHSLLMDVNIIRTKVTIAIVAVIVAVVEY